MGAELVPIAESRLLPVPAAGWLAARPAPHRDERREESWSWHAYCAYRLLPPSRASALALYERAGVPAPAPLVDVLA